MPTIEQARPWYPATDAVHGFDHVLRVYSLAARLAEAEGADAQIVGASVLLHDAQSPEAVEGAAGTEERHDHHQRSAEFAAQLLQAEGWPAEKITAVQHCILAHRFRDESTAPISIEAKVVFDADKLDAIGAIGAARAIAYAVQAGQPIYSRPSRLFLETGQTEPGEPHSAFHEYVFKLSKIQNRLYTVTGRHLAEARQRRMEDFFNGLASEIENGD